MGGGRWLAQAGSRAAVGLALICWLLAPAGGAAPSREWEEGVQAARREGRLVVYDAFGGAVPTVQYAAERFEATHRVKVEIAVMRASESIERIRVEQRAGRAVADLVTAGSGTTRPMLDEGVLRPFERLPSAPRIAPQVRLKVQEWELQQHLLPFLIQLYGILVNTNLVRPEEEPRSWNDLADPRWRGRLIMDDPRAPGGGQVLFQVTYRALGRRFQEELAAQRPFLTRGIADAASRVARGEFAVMAPFALGLYPRVRGGPVKLIIPREGAPYVPLGVSLPRRSDHPNAAVVFSEFLLSREVQVRLMHDFILPVVRGYDQQAPEEVRPFLRVRLWDTVVDPRVEPEYLRRANEIYR